MERNIKTILEYEGTRYHGWQLQENADSIQGRLEQAIFKLCGERVRTTAAGRTDAGVHARGQVVNFRLKSKLPINKIEMGLNAHLPRDICVVSAEEVDDSFNARFAARKRVYQYFISTQRTAMLRNFSYQFFHRFDPAVLAPLSEMLLGKHDFGAFSRLEVQSATKICTVYQSQWRQEGPLWIYRIAADRFLHGMVRTIVGTLMDVARGRFQYEDFRRIFESCDRLQAGPAAPARGLVLEEVIY